jgi:hypothetical protein
MNTSLFGITEIEYLTNSIGELIDNAGVITAPDSPIHDHANAEAEYQIPEAMYELYRSVLKTCPVCLYFTQVGKEHAIVFSAEFDLYTLGEQYSDNIHAMRTHILKAVSVVKDAFQKHDGLIVDCGFNTGVDNCDEIAIFVPFSAKLSQDELIAVGEKFNELAYASIPEQLKVKTAWGQLIATPTGNPEYPGIFLEYEDSKESNQVALLEVPESEALRLLVWSDKDNEDFTHEFPFSTSKTEMEKKIFEVIDTALALAGYKIMDGDCEAVIVRHAGSDRDFQISIEEIH